MKKCEKGEYGYLLYYKRTKLLATLGFAAMIEFIVITLLLMFDTTSHVMIVIPVLLSLPLAKFFIAYLIVAKCKSLKEEEYRKISDAVNEPGILYDIAISQYEGIRFFQSVTVKNGKIYGLVTTKTEKYSRDDYVKWIEESANDKKYTYMVKVYYNIEEYVNKINSTSEPSDTTKLIDAHIKERILDSCV